MMNESDAGIRLPTQHRNRHVRRKRNFAVDHVALHQVRFALERIAPAAAARREDPNNLAGQHRFAIDKAAEIARLTLDVDGDAKWQAGLSAIDAVAAEPHAIGGDDGAAIDQRAVMLLVAKSATALAGAAGIGA